MEWYLTALGLTSETVLTELERAAAARSRYQVESAQRGIKLELNDTVDLMLMNHMMLLDSLATLGGVENIEIQRAARRGMAAGKVL